MTEVQGPHVVGDLLECVSAAASACDRSYTRRGFLVIYQSREGAPSIVDTLPELDPDSLPHATRQAVEARLKVPEPLLGAFSGGTFALLLAAAEKQRSVAQLSQRRLAAWGAIGGVLVPIIASLGVLALTDLHLASNAPAVFLMPAILGSSSALGTLWMAQRGSAEVDTLALPT